MRVRKYNTPKINIVFTTALADTVKLICALIFIILYRNIIISLENKIPAIIPDAIAASATVSVSIDKTLAI